MVNPIIGPASLTTFSCRKVFRKFGASQRNQLLAKSPAGKHNSHTIFGFRLKLPVESLISSIPFIVHNYFMFYQKYNVCCLKATWQQDVIGWKLNRNRLQTLRTIYQLCISFSFDRRRTPEMADQRATSVLNKANHETLCVSPKHGVLYRTVVVIRLFVQICTCIFVHITHSTHAATMPRDVGYP